MYVKTKTAYPKGSMHVKTKTEYPKGSKSPSSALFTKQTAAMPKGDPSRTDYSGDSTSPHGGHHTSTDTVRVMHAEGGVMSKSEASYPKSVHKSFKNEKMV